MQLRTCVRYVISNQQKASNLRLSLTTLVFYEQTFTQHIFVSGPFDGDLFDAIDEDSAPAEREIDGRVREPIERVSEIASRVIVQEIPIDYLLSPSSSHKFLLQFAKSESREPKNSNLIFDNSCNFFFA